MYIAHECLILGEEYYHLKSKTADGQPITFVDYAPVFRNQAANLLKAQLDLQRDTLTSFIKEIGGSINSLPIISDLFHLILAFHNITNEGENQDLLKRSINKCIKQMENLVHNWRKIFSPHVYFKVIGNSHWKSNLFH